MSTETRVGLFSLSGVALFAAGALILGDVQFRHFYPIDVVFDNAEGLPDKGPVKVAGVEVGQVGRIALDANDSSRARVTLNIQEGVIVRRGARAHVASTGLIGSKYLDLTLGDRSAPSLKEGETIEGDPSVTVDQIMVKIGEFLRDDKKNGAVGENLRVAMANFRQVSEALAGSLGRQRAEMSEIVENIREMSAHAKVVAADLREITGESKVDAKEAIAKIRSVSERLDVILARIQNGNGVISQLINDENMGKELKQTMGSIKVATRDAESVMGRITRAEAYWDYRQRYDFGDVEARTDVGLRIVPRPGRFYFIQGNNLGAREDRKDDPEADMERRNTLTVEMGRDYGPVTLYGGVIRSAAGAGLRWRPLPEKSKWSQRVELEAEAFRFGRKEVIQGVELKGPIINLGARVNALTPWLWVGGQVEDVAERKNFNANVNFTFRDEDIAYVLGLAGLAGAH